MRVLIVLTLAGLLATGCQKSLFHGKLEGRFKGTFQRITNGVADPMISQVAIHFSDNDFTGNSTLNRYPAICEGTYNTAGSMMKVTNSCFFTADFDWSLIFTGDYDFKLKGDSLTIWKEYPYGKDVYQLMRAE